MKKVFLFIAFVLMITGLFVPIKLFNYAQIGYILGTWSILFAALIIWVFWFLEAETVVQTAGVALGIIVIMLIASVPVILTKKGGLDEIFLMRAFSGQLVFLSAFFTVMVYFCVFIPLIKKDQKQVITG